MSVTIDGVLGLIPSGSSSVYSNGSVLGSSIAAGTISGTQIGYINSISSTSSFSIIAGSNTLVIGSDASIGNSTGNLNLNASNVTVSGNIQIGGNIIANTAQLSSVYLSPYAAFRNRLHNGDMRIAQRNAYGTLQSRTIASNTALPNAVHSGNNTYAIDRWFCVSNGGTITLAQINGTGSTQYRAQITGTAGVSALYYGQRIEQANSYDLAGSVCTLAVDLSNSLLTSVTWTVSYANSADAFGTISTPTKTTVATGSWTVTSSIARYTAVITVPAAATTGLEILFQVGAQTSGTWVIGNAQFEQGNVATPFDRRPYSTELLLCQRYCPAWQATAVNQIVGQGGGNGTTNLLLMYQFPVPVRIPPTNALPSVSSLGHFTLYDSNGNSLGVVNGSGAGFVSLYSNASFWTVTSGVTAGQVVFLRANNAAAFIYWEGCEIP